MLKKKNKHIDQLNMVEENSPTYGFVAQSEEEKLNEEICRSDIEKHQLFTRMLRRNDSLKKAIIPHTK